jgi:hypothetical protein
MGSLASTRKRKSETTELHVTSTGEEAIYGSC